MYLYDYLHVDSNLELSKRDLRDFIIVIHILQEHMTMIWSSFETAKSSGQKIVFFFLC